MLTKGLASLLANNYMYMYMLTIVHHRLVYSQA